jgi:hypothetical protein
MLVYNVPKRKELKKNKKKTPLPFTNPSSVRPSWFSGGYNLSNNGSIKNN